MNVYCPDFVPEPHSPIPLHHQLCESIRVSLRRARPEAGTRLIPILSLAGRLGLNRDTVRKAYEALLSEGVLEKSPGGRIISVSPSFAASCRDNFLPSLGLVLPLRMESLLTQNGRTALELVAGIMDAATDLGFSTTVIPLSENDGELPRLRRWLDGMLPKLNGLIYLGETRGGNHERSFEMLLRESSIAQVFIGGAAFMPHLGSVTVDTSGIRAAVEHLTGLGHRRIGLVAEPIPDRRYFRLQTADRADDIAAAIAAEVPFREEWRFIRGGNLAPGGLPAGIMSGSERPTALICHNDIIAAEVMVELAAAGIRVPEDISVVGYDDSIIAESSSPPLTSIIHPRRAMGRAAAAMIARSLREHRPVNSCGVCLSAGLKVRASTAAVRDVVVS